MNQERTFQIKQTKHGLTVRHQTNAVGAENIEALGVLMRAAPDDAILVWDKPGQISAVNAPISSVAKKERRGGRQTKAKLF